jgi:SGNH hydrolase-like domain, acetyltransferase AlgX
MKTITRPILILFALSTIALAFSETPSTDLMAKCPATRSGPPGFWMIGTKTERMFLNIHFPKGYSLTQGVPEKLQDLSRVLEAQGSHLVIVPIPSATLFYPEILDHNDPLISDFDFSKKLSNYQEAMKLNNSLGINTIDLSQAIMSLKGQPEEFFFKRDTHWTPSGARAAATAITEFIKTTFPDYALEPKTSYTLTPKNSDSTPGFGRWVTNLCKDIVVPPEPYTPYTAVPDSSVGLLGDVTQQVLVLGDSFGRMTERSDWGFDAFLANGLSLNVQNEATPAGGYIASPTRYFSMRDPNQAIPKYVVWTYFYNSPQLYFFDEIMPALAACKNPQALVGETLPPLEKLDRYFLRLSNVDTSQDLTLKLAWPDGSNQEKTFVRQKLRITTSNYFWNIPQRNGSFPISIGTPEVLMKKASASICQY